MSAQGLGCVKTQTRSVAAEETSSKSPIVEQTFPSESGFSWSKKKHSRDFSIFRVFTQPRSIASFERCRHVGFTRDSGRMFATQRTNALGQKTTSALKADYVFATAGGVHVPLRIEGAFSLGQYMRSMAMKSPFGAGNQFASLSAPGVSFWK